MKAGFTPKCILVAPGFEFTELYAKVLSLQL